MAAIALLIVVICGHLFVGRRPLSRFKQAKSSGWDAYFHVGAWGILFSMLAGLLVLAGAWIIDALGYGPMKTAKGFSPIVAEAIKPEWLALFYWAILSCILGWICGLAANTQRQIKLAIVNVTLEDELETILYISITSTIPIQITTKSRKIYIGFAMTQITRDDFSRREYTSILPLLSGYRDKDTMKIMLTNDYQEFYKNTDNVDLGQFRVVIPVSEITNVAFFDHAAHSYISRADQPIFTELSEEILETP
ncbi:hypothetical protein [Paludibacterium purpuratum]|uniref:Uncharacterized protein n=1 Tax=Paludibacterium purpuratum TaxID=1144873 RepID=A0A4R7B6B6_9NEIS|nr:hypothetical protein [Paludibacterium purpuratum]TDR80220.1 hypothetical protein DFP86_10575 [Paludibacterium purpuratum]